MSSMKAAIFLPIGGPYVSLVRFSTDDSMICCTPSEDVLDEKLMFRIICKNFEKFYKRDTGFYDGFKRTLVSMGKHLRKFAMTDVLAVPRSPTNSTGRFTYLNRKNYK